MTHILAHLGLISVLHFTGVQERESTVIVNESPVAFYCRRGNWLLLLQVTDWGEVEPPQPTFGKIFSFEFCFSSVFFRFLVTFFSDFKKGTIQVRTFQTVVFKSTCIIYCYNIQEQYVFWISFCALKL